MDEFVNNLRDQSENQRRDVLDLLPCVECGATERCPLCQALAEVRHLRQLRHDLGLRNQILARDRARVHRAAIKLLAAIDEDDDNVSVYIEAREALRSLVEVRVS